MFHKASGLEFKDGTVLELTFQDGTVKQYDISVLFDKYPQLCALKNRELFLSGRLIGPYGIVWNDELDIEAETVYEDGVTVGTVELSSGVIAGEAVAAARAYRGVSQKELAASTGIDQSDISKIERGVYNPSVKTLDRIAKALGARLEIKLTIDNKTE